MKKLFITLSFIAFSGILAYGQTTQPPAPRSISSSTPPLTAAQKEMMNKADKQAKIETEKMAKDLKLTTEQKDKIYRVNYAFEVRRLSAGKSADAQKLQQMKESMYRQVLTPDQLKKYEAASTPTQNKLTPKS